MPEIPVAIRAAAGLAATVLDEVRKLPEELPGLPVRAIGLAMQTSLRLQQQFSGLVARGDEVITSLRGDSGEGLATFDDDEPAPASARAGGLGSRTSSFDLVDDVPAGFEPDDEPPADEAVESVLADDDVAELADPADLDALTTALAADSDSIDDDAAIDAAAARRGRSLTDDVVDGLPDDPIADALIDAVEEVADEIGLEAPLDDRVVAAEAHLRIDAGDADAPAAVLDPAAETADAVTEVAVGLAAVPDLADIAEGSEAAPLADADRAPDTDPLTDSTTDDDVPAADDVLPVDPDVEAGTHSEPVEGYDLFSIASLRGRLRKYPTELIQALFDYEEATRARAPYLTLLRNRLEKVQASA